jgi:two-component system, NtrC family, sensor kinase
MIKYILLILISFISKECIASHQNNKGLYKGTCSSTTTKKYNNEPIIQSIKVSKNALSIVQRINSNFTKIKHLLDFHQLLVLLKNKDKIVDVYYELVLHSENLGYKEGIIKAYSLLGHYYFQAAKYNEAIKYYKKSLAQCSLTNDIPLATVVLQSLGIIYYDMGQFNEAIEYFTNLLEIGIKHNNKNIRLLSLNYLAYNYSGLCEYEKAIKYSLEAMDISKELNDREMLALILHNIGNVYFQIRNYPKSLIYNLQSLKIKEEIGNKIMIAASLNSIGMIYFYLKNYNLSINHLNKSIELYSDAMFHQGLATVFDDIGFVYKELGNQSLAITFYMKAFNISLKLQDDWNIAKVSNHIGQVFLLQNNFIEAKYYFDKSLFYSKNIFAKDLLIDCYKSLTDLYQRNGNYQSAFNCMKLYTAVKDSILLNSSHEIADIQLKYETQKWNKENNRLKIRNIIQKMEFDHLKTISWQLLFGVTILVSLLSLTYSKYKIKQNQNIMLTKIVEESIEKQIRQKKIIFHQAGLTSLGEYSTAITHEINQPLQLIFFDIETLQLLLNNEYIDHIKVNEILKIIIINLDRIKFITTYVKNFSCRQKDYINQRFDMNAMVRNTIWIVQRHYEKMGIKLNLIFCNHQNIIHGNLFKLEQALLNLLSNARDAIEEIYSINICNDIKCITIKCTTDNKYAILSVEDQGIGIKPEIKPFIFNPFFTTKNFGKGIGLGLSIVKEVIEDMNGEVEVVSKYLKGTSVHIKIPIHISNMEN